MNKSKIQYWIDVGLLLSFLGVFLTGIFKFWRESFSWVFEIIPKEQMRTIHDWSGLIMGFLVILHLIVNWCWIKKYN